MSIEDSILKYVYGFGSRVVPIASHDTVRILRLFGAIDLSGWGILYRTFILAVP